MNTTTLSPERYFALCADMIRKGWMPVGQVGAMLFRRKGKTYDLSAADLGQLEKIERDGLFLATTPGTLFSENLY